MEIWLPIEGYGNCYSVSNEGRVMRTSPRKVKIAEHRSRAKPFKPSINKPQIHRDGYLQVRIGPTGHQHTINVHRLVAKAFVSNPQNKTFVNHKDGNKLNCRADNLEWVSRSENALHSIALGLQTVLRGEGSGSAKLTEPDIIAIRKDKRSGREIAADYGIDRSNIYCIKNRKTWTHIP